MAIDKKKCAKRLNHQMKKNGIGVSKLSKEAKVSKATVEKLLHEESVVSKKTFERIAERLGISSGFLAGEHDDVHGPEFSGKHKCEKCGRETGQKSKFCSRCYKMQKTEEQKQKEQKQKIEKKIPLDHGLIGMMKETSRIAREAREKGMSYGKYVALYGDGSL